MRKLAIAAFSFGAGTFAAVYLLHGTSLLYSAGICALLGLFGLLLRGKGRTAITLMFFFAAVGILWRFGYDSLFLQNAYALCGTSGSFTAEISDYPEKTDYGVVCRVKLDTGDLRPVTAVFYTYTDETSELSPGDRVSFDGEILPADNINGEDTSVFTSDGCFLRIYADETVCTQKAEKLPFRYLPGLISRKIGEIVDKIYPEKSRGLMKALLTGKTQTLKDDVEFTTELKLAGVYHIAAVSGMHVTFFVGMMNTFIRRRRAALIASVPAVIVFMAVVGFTPSVTRAGIMQLIIIAASLLMREPDSITSLSVALAAILAANPYSVESVGLQLSFGATIGILLFAERITGGVLNRVRPRKRFKSRFAIKIFNVVLKSLAVSLSAMVFTAPMSALYFGYVSIIAPLTNLFILPVMNLIFCTGIVSVAVGAVLLKAGAVIGGIAYLPILYLRLIVRIFGSTFFAALYTENIYNVIWLIYVYAMFALSLIFKAKLRQMILPVSFAAISLCCMLMGEAFADSENGLTASVLDVGQGQCVIITSGSYTAVMDCGGNKNSGAEAASFLKSRGRDNIDVLILSHYHDDHVNGAEELCAAVNVSEVIGPRPEEEDTKTAEAIANAAGRDIFYVVANTEITLGNMTVSLYPPFGRADENERCLAAVFTENDYDVLITGDMPAGSERQLAYSEKLPDAELMVVGHHGSKYSSCDELIEAVSPERAVISVGRNSYGHPSDETIYRFTSRGAAVYRTDISGDVIIKAGE